MDQICAGGRDEPIDPGRGKASPQFCQHRQGVNDVAHRRELDQEDTLEIARAEIILMSPARSRDLECHRSEAMATDRLIQAERRWRIISRRTTLSSVHQLNCTTRRSPMKGVWP